MSKHPNKCGVKSELQDGDIFRAESCGFLPVSSVAIESNDGRGKCVRRARPLFPDSHDDQPASNFVNWLSRHQSCFVSLKKIVRGVHASHDWCLHRADASRSETDRRKPE